MRRGPGSRLSLAALAAVALFAVGCTAEAEEVACDHAEDLREGIAEIDEEIRDGDLDDARLAVDDLRDDFDVIVREMSAIDNAAEDRITPLLAPAAEAMIVLERAGTLDELSTALDSGRGALEAVAAETEAALACD